MKRTDKEIIEAMTFIKEQHNGELPYQFGTFECAKMMVKYLNKQFEIHDVVRQNEQFYCVSSDALVYGEPCKKWCEDEQKWCEDEHCKVLCKQ